MSCELIYQNPFTVPLHSRSHNGTPYSDIKSSSPNIQSSLSTMLSFFGTVYCILSHSPVSTLLGIPVLVELGSDISRGFGDEGIF